MREIRRRKNAFDVTFFHSGTMAAAFVCLLALLAAATTASALVVPSSGSLRPSAARARSSSILLDESLSEADVKAKLANLRASRGRPRRSVPQEPAAPAVVAEKKAEAAPPRPTGFQLSDDGQSPIERLRSKVGSQQTQAAPLDAAAADELVTFLNDYLGDEMLAWLMKATEIGKTAASKNAWSRGLWVPKTAELLSLTCTALSFRIGVAVRGQAEPTMLTTELTLPREVATVDELRDALLELGCR